MAASLDIIILDCNCSSTTNPGLSGRSCMNPESEEERRTNKMGRRKEDRVKNGIVQDAAVAHQNVLLRPARRVFVSVLFVLVCIAIALVFRYLQNHFTAETNQLKNQANQIQQQANQIQQQTNQLHAQAKQIQFERWKGAYDECINTNKRNKDSLAFIAKLAKQQSKNASPTIKKEIRQQVGQYHLLFQALSPYHPNCRARATQLTKVPAPPKNQNP